ncbi:MAG: TonB-dependent receptor [Bacteroidetes bacterium]|nr:TonB-dependent receptor [Bacteroidota bacterium]
MKYLIITLFLCLVFGKIFSQTYTISGTIEDAKTGEKLLGANAYDELTYKGTASNYYGFYSLTLPKGKIKFTISYIGYQSIQKEFFLNSDTVINLSLNPTIELKEVLVLDNAKTQVKSTRMSVAEIPIQTIKSLPVLMGEVDIIKSIQLLPGVQSGGEGMSGLYVRGGGPDQNLILLDGVPVYNANHLFGFFSVFNADAVQSLSLVKGAFPARYGGRLSSVLDIKMKEGNNKEFKGEGSVGIISSKLTLEGPIIDDKTSFIISGRRTYLDILSQPIIRYTAKKNGYDKFIAGYYFYDLNAKINHKFSDKSRLFLSSYMGRDKAYFKVKDSEGEQSFENNMDLHWGNITTALRWNYIINNKLFSNTTITYSEYNLLTSIEMTEKQSNPTSTDHFKVDYSSGIDDVAGKIDFDYIPNTNHYIRFGINNIYHTFNPGVSAFKYSAEQTSVDTTFGNNAIYSNEFSVYVEDDIKITGNLKANIGLHYSGFYVKDKLYHSVQPRLSVRYLFNEKLSVKAAYSVMNQYLLLLTNSSMTMPTDLWLPVTDKIKPQKSIQYALGTSYAITDDINISVEGFYKEMSNLIEYREGSSFFSISNDWEDKVVQGKGTSYGAEFFVQKKVGKTAGWIGYTLSWSNRKFEDINFGKTYPYKYDRRHDISIVITHKFSDNIDAGLTWVYGTGNAVTLATEQYVVKTDNGYEYVEHYEKRNGYRMAAYHRFDFSANFHKQKKWGKRTWSFGVYNAYNRKNPFFLNFEEDYNNDRRVLKQYSLFPIIPSISYSFIF